MNICCFVVAEQIISAELTGKYIVLRRYLAEGSEDFILAGVHDNGSYCVNRCNMQYLLHSA